MTNWIIQIIGWVVGLGIITIIFQHYFNKKISKFNLINESQFRAFSKLWKSLMDLKRKGDELWDKVDKEELSVFVRYIENAHISLQNNSLLLNKKDYEDLKEILDKFWSYKVGKERLIDMKDEKIKDKIIHVSGAILVLNERQSQVFSNEAIKKEYERLLNNLREKLQSKMGVK